MNKIKRNETIEKGILFAAILPQIDGLTAGEVMDKTAEAYKENEAVKIFTAEETDSIMQILESMPGYTHEKFFTACTAINDIDEDNKTKVFQLALYVTYIMLSITNPEFFEDYEEENNND